jgi:hypothetical protein
VIKDRNAMWQFYITAEEQEKVERNELQFVWDRRYEWCLVNQKQRMLLTDGINYNVQLNDLRDSYGLDAMSEWASIRRLQEDAWRQYQKIVHLPLTTHAKSDPTHKESVCPVVERSVVPSSTSLLQKA